MVTPLPLPVMVLPNVPVWDPFDQPVKVPSSKPVSGIVAAWTEATGTKRASRTRGTMSADTRLNFEYDR